MAQNSHDMSPGRRFFVTGGAIVGMAAMTLVGCAPSGAEKPPATTSATQSEGETSSPETTPTAEFTPGATGKYSPQELRQLDNDELVDRLRMTGDSPEELAQSEVDTYAAFLMSGTTEEELEPYKPLSIPNIERYAKDIDAKYATAACEAWVREGCELNQDTRIAHEIILHAFAAKRLLLIGENPNVHDFQVGTTATKAVRVTEGEFNTDGRSFTIVTENDLSSNFKGSIVEALADGDDGKWYRSIQNVVRNRRVTTTYHSQGDHFVHTKSSAEAIN